MSSTPIPSSEYAIAVATGMGFCVGDCNDFKAYTAVVSAERAVTEGFIVIVDPKE